MFLKEILWLLCHNLDAEAAGKLQEPEKVPFLEVRLASASMEMQPMFQIF